MANADRPRCRIRFHIRNHALESSGDYRVYHVAADPASSAACGGAGGDPSERVCSTASDVWWLNAATSLADLVRLDRAARRVALAECAFSRARARRCLV